LPIYFGILSIAFIGIGISRDDCRQLMGCCRMSQNGRVPSHALGIRNLNLARDRAAHDPEAPFSFLQSGRPAMLSAMQQVNLLWQRVAMQKASIMKIANAFYIEHIGPNYPSEQFLTPDISREIFPRPTVGNRVTVFRPYHWWEMKSFRKH